MKDILKTIDLLEQNGYYRTADAFQDQFMKLAAFPYNLTSIDELPMSARQYTWERNKADFEESDTKFWKELKQRIPDYRSLNTDPDEEFNMEGALHGPDSVPGPAYVEQTSPGVSPSMNGGLEDFTWDKSHDANQGPEYWKNLQPRR